MVVGEFLQLVVGPVLHRVRNEHQGRIDTERFGLLATFFLFLPEVVIGSEPPTAQGDSLHEPSTIVTHSL